MAWFCDSLRCVLRMQKDAAADAMNCWEQHERRNFGAPKSSRGTPQH